MKVLLIIAILFISSGCGTTNGRTTFLGISKYEKHCVDQWTFKKKRIIYRKCFK